MPGKPLSEHNDVRGRLVCTGRRNIDYGQFVEIAERLSKQFQGKIVEKVEDGFSTRYWDIKIDGTTVCFHYHDMIQDFEIISLEGNRSDETARRLAASLA